MYGPDVGERRHYGRPLTGRTGDQTLDAMAGAFEENRFRTRKRHVHLSPAPVGTHPSGDTAFHPGRSQWRRHPRPFCGGPLFTPGGHVAHNPSCERVKNPGCVCTGCGGSLHGRPTRIELAEEATEPLLAELRRDAELLWFAKLGTGKRRERTRWCSGLWVDGRRRSGCRRGWAVPRTGEKRGSPAGPHWGIRPAQEAEVPESGTVTMPPGRQSR